MPKTLQGPHFITTEPTVTRCAHCNQHLLAATVGGLDCHIDTTPVNPDGELAALLHGITTYELRGQLLIRRTVNHIRAGAAGCVLTAHICHPVPANYVDSDQLKAAVALVQLLLGAVVVESTDQPNF